MTYRSPYERKLSLRRMLRRFALIAVLLVVALWLDGPMYRLLSVVYEPTTPAIQEVTPGAEVTDPDRRSASERRARLESRDWYQMFRAAGYLPTWLLIGGAVLVVARSRGRGPGGGMAIIAGAIATGLAAEILKPVLGRHRPLGDGSLHWNPLLGGVLDPATYNHSLGLPSSHAAVAFGAAFVVVRLYPGAGWFAIIAASGCGLTRLLAGAHAFSDVLVAVLVAWLISAVVVRLFAEEPVPARASRFD